MRTPQMKLPMAVRNTTVKTFPRVVYHVHNGLKPSLRMDMSRVYKRLNATALTLNCQIIFSP